MRKIIRQDHQGAYIRLNDLLLRPPASSALESLVGREVHCVPSGLGLHVRLTPGGDSELWLGAAGQE